MENRTMRSTRRTIFAALFVTAASFLVLGFVEVICENLTTEQLPPGPTLGLMSMLTQASMKTRGDCLNPRSSDIKLLLHTRRNPDRPIALNAANPTQVDPRKKVILLIHGWLCNSTSYGFPELRDAYLKRYDCNLVIVDWSKLSWQLYPTSVCYLPKIAKFVANFLCLLNRQLKIGLNTVHLVGHSLGGQMSGFIGQSTVSICKEKVGRITAMDPAGPLYQGLPTSQRVDKSDAVFVDVIHTNEGVLGYVGDCGDVDFYVNCGAMQPGCPNIELEHTVNHPLAAGSCEHFRSVEYMAESVNSNNFKARACTACPIICGPDLLKSTEVTMGEDCPINVSGGYVLDTNSQPPFAVGSRKQNFKGIF